MATSIQALTPILLFLASAALSALVLRCTRSHDPMDDWPSPDVGAHSCRMPTGLPPRDYAHLSPAECALAAEELENGRCMYTSPPFDWAPGWASCLDSGWSVVGFVPWALSFLVQLCSLIVARLRANRTTRKWAGWGPVGSLMTDLWFCLKQEHSVVGIYAAHPLSPLRRSTRCLCLFLECTYFFWVNWMLLYGWGLHDFLHKHVTRYISDYSDYCLGDTSCDYALVRLQTDLVDNKGAIANLLNPVGGKAPIQVALVFSLFAFLLFLPWLFFQEWLLDLHNWRVWPASTTPARRHLLRRAAPFLLLTVGGPVAAALFTVALVRTGSIALVLEMQAITLLFDLLLWDNVFVLIGFAIGYRKEVRKLRLAGHLESEERREAGHDVAPAAAGEIDMTEIRSLLS